MIWKNNVYFSLWLSLSLSLSIYIYELRCISATALARLACQGLQFLVCALLVFVVCYFLCDFCLETNLHVITNKENIFVDDAHDLFQYPFSALFLMICCIANSALRLFWLHIELILHAFPRYILK